MHPTSGLSNETYKDLLHQTLERADVSADGAIALVGLRSVCTALYDDVVNAGFASKLGITVCLDDWSLPCDGVRLLSAPGLDTIVIAADAEKQWVLRSIEPFVAGLPYVVVAGYDHLGFANCSYADLARGLEEPSLANGYPNCRVHLYQCLENAARLGLSGAVVEFGMFRGGTTMFLHRAVKRLGQDWRVLGFDSFSGFPPADHLFDIYSHPDLAAISLSEVRERFAETDVEIIAGDVRETAPRILENTPVVLAFVDTDNYSSAVAALTSIRDNVAVGGAIVLDHFTGTDRFVRTLGERMAAEDVLVRDRRYFNLHETGVFIRQML